MDYSHCLSIFAYSLYLRKTNMGHQNSLQPPPLTSTKPNSKWRWTKIVIGTIAAGIRLVEGRVSEQFARILSGATGYCWLRKIGGKTTA
jgi:hypothetical protein